jgi:AraC family transcriptional regulator, arabinose operon regulatory protein
MGNIWITRFYSNPVVQQFPCPRAVAEQIVENSSYHFEGRNRKSGNHYLFEYSLDGEGVFWDAKGRYAIRKGTGFLCRVDDPETGYYYPSDSITSWKILFFTFDHGGALVDALLRRFGPVYTLSLDSAPILRLREYQNFAGAPLEVTPGEGVSIVGGILAALADAGAEKMVGSVNAWLVQRVRKTVQIRLEENLNVSTIAEEIDISVEHLCRVFHKETGMTPYTYITRQKVRRACELLHGTNLSCKEICARLQYDNTSHFARTFRRIAGVTPTEFRRRGEIPLF